MKICSKMGSKMESKLGSNPWKFELQGWFGAPGRPSWRQDGPRCDFGRVWGSIWRSVGAHLGAKMGQVAAKMALSCPTWRQDGPKMAILDFKMANLRPFRKVSCPLLRILGAKSQIAENLKKTSSFYSFLKVFGVLGGALGGHVASSWRDVGLCWASWAPSWSNLATRWGPRAPRWAKMAHRSAKTRQDSRT